MCNQKFPNSYILVWGHGDILWTYQGAIRKIVILADCVALWVKVCTGCTTGGVTACSERFPTWQTRWQCCPWLWVKPKLSVNNARLGWGSGRVWPDPDARCLPAVPGAGTQDPATWIVPQSENSCKTSARYVHDAARGTPRIRVDCLDESRCQRRRVTAHTPRSPNVDLTSSLPGRSAYQDPQILV